MKFTVVTPSYNQLDWLRLNMLSVREAFRRLKSENAKVKLEQRIQDGGSAEWEEFREETEAALRSDPLPGYKVHMVSEVDEGMYEALNRGFDGVGGDLCMWLNSDEQLLPDTLRTVVRMWREDPEFDVLVGDVILTDAEGAPLGYRRVKKPEKWHIRACSLQTYSCAMVMKPCLMSGRPFETKWKSIGDAVLMNRWLEEKRRIQVMNRPLAVFAITGENLSSEASPERKAWCRERGWNTSLVKPFARMAHVVTRAVRGDWKTRKVNLRYLVGRSGDVKTYRGPLRGTWPGKGSAMPKMPDVQKTNGMEPGVNQEASP